MWGAGSAQPVVPAALRALLLDNAAPPAALASAPTPTARCPPHTDVHPPLGTCRVGGDAAKARKVAALQNDVAALEAALEAAKQEYGRVTERNLQVGGWLAGWLLDCFAGVLRQRGTRADGGCVRCTAKRAAYARAGCAEVMRAAPTHAAAAPPRLPGLVPAPPLPLAGAGAQPAGTVQRVCAAGARPGRGGCKLGRGGWGGRATECRFAGVGCKGAASAPGACRLPGRPSLLAPEKRSAAFLSCSTSAACIQTTSFLSRMFNITGDCCFSFFQVNALYGQRCLDIWRGVGEDFGAHAQLDAQQRQ